MPPIIALATLILLIGSLAALFTWFAFAIRRDSQERFQRVREQLERDANRVIGHLFGFSEYR
jgi:hypothetical protein